MHIISIDDAKDIFLCVYRVNLWLMHTSQNPADDFLCASDFLYVSDFFTLFHYTLLETPPMHYRHLFELAGW